MSGGCSSNKIDVVVAGHICLDIIPTIPIAAGADLIQPGKLIDVGSAVLSTGGVANTGLALHRLGFNTQLMMKVGADGFGSLVASLLRSQGAKLADSIMVSAGASTSYSIVLAPVGVDRTFLHFPGANHTFRADDLPSLVGRIFHFGYPTIMRSMYANGGVELAAVMDRAKAVGMITSLDLCWPEQPALEQDWHAILARVLPKVDIFLPSIEEISLLLEGQARSISELTESMLRDLAARLIDWGSKLAVLKLGEQGLYLRTARCIPFGEAWSDIEHHARCFETKVVSTTGAGDCAIAGFLAGLIQGLRPNEALVAAAAAGACGVEVTDATSGVPTWETLRNRVASGWPTLPSRVFLERT